ncbi:AraC family transcriptional regulator [Bordetella sp. BOR01]|uniref:AraC-like ligand-binding domain-containing protein n=1 Tax=Bordetella sp. BOR01 TaxID=2854779 RepID=UPI001C464385|nr:AraC family transcriptional regulator [Bordetella sp. BOR01]MBV7486044.1 AraC family transcriptional regulator [Bordetella sp. BOR01]
MTASLFAQVPFEQYRIVDTADPDEARQRIGQVLNSYRLQVIRGRILHSRLDLVPCGRLSLLKSRHGYGADISIDPDCQCLDGYYLLVLPTQGQAVFYFDGGRIEVSPDKAFLISPGRRFHFSVSHDYEQVLLRLDRTAIAEAWHRLTGHDQAPDICFDAVIPLYTTSWQALQPMLQWVARCSGLSQDQNITQAALLAQIEMLVATTLLLHQPHNMAAYLWPAPPPSAPQAMRRAQAYMLEHLGERLPVAMVASHCGLSVRRLQALFHDECGQSPLQWLRMQRLQAVRQALQAGNADKISAVATGFGFTHLGEFSRAYRQAFGETPQQTRN